MCSCGIECCTLLRGVTINHALDNLVYVKSPSDPADSKMYSATKADLEGNKKSRCL